MASAPAAACETATRNPIEPSGMQTNSRPHSAASGCPGGCALPSVHAAAANSLESSQYTVGTAQATYSAKPARAAMAGARLMMGLARAAVQGVPTEAHHE